MAGKSFEDSFHIGQSSYAPDGRSYSSVSFDLMLQQYQKAMVKKITKSLGKSVKKLKIFLQNSDKTKLSSL